MKAEFTFSAVPNDIVMLIFHSMVTGSSVLRSSDRLNTNYMLLYSEKWLTDYLEEWDDDFPRTILSSLHKWSIGENQDYFSHENNPYPETDRFEGEPDPRLVYVRVCDDQHPPNDVSWENVFTCEGDTCTILSRFYGKGSEVTITRLGDGKYSLAANGDRESFQKSAGGQIGRGVAKNPETFTDFQVLETETSEKYLPDAHPHNLFLLPTWARVKIALDDALNGHGVNNGDYSDSIKKAVNLFR